MKDVLAWLFIGAWFLSGVLTWIHGMRIPSNRDRIEEINICDLLVFPAFVIMGGFGAGIVWLTEKCMDVQCPAIWKRKP